MKGFQNRTAIVTGGGSGIGRALCEELGKQGADVIIADVNLDGAKNVAEAMKQAGAQAEAVHLDVVVEEDVRNLVEKTAANKGRLDYIFNNAGIGIGGEVRDMNLDQWKRIVDINLWGVTHGTLAAYHVMVRQGTRHSRVRERICRSVRMPWRAPSTETASIVIPDVAMRRR